MAYNFDDYLTDCTAHNCFDSLYDCAEHIAIHYALYACRLDAGELLHVMTLEHNGARFTYERPFNFPPHLLFETLRDCPEQKRIDSIYMDICHDSDVPYIPIKCLVPVSRDDWEKLESALYANWDAAAKAVCIRLDELTNDKMRQILC